MKILKAMMDSTEDAPVREVRRGLYWTAVVSSYCGLASTMVKDICLEENSEATPFHYAGMSARKLAKFIFSNDISESSLGWAALNSLIKVDEAGCIEQNADELIIKYGAGKNVSVIGHFPFTDKLRKVVKNLWVIEKHLKPGDIAADGAQVYVPVSDVVAISSTTLINHTLSSILDLCKPDAVKMLLGPTTPMTEVFFEYGIDIVCGSKVVDEQKALCSISEGANFRQLKKTGAVKLLAMISKHFTHM